MHCVDFQVMQLLCVCVCVCVCVRVCEQIGRRTITLRPQFFTYFHHILHAARKYGWFDANCSWDKPEVGFWILEVYKFRLQQFFAFAGWLTDWLTDWMIDRLKLMIGCQVLFCWLLARSACADLRVEEHHKKWELGRIARMPLARWSCAWHEVPQDGKPSRVQRLQRTTRYQTWNWVIGSQGQ